MGAGAAAKIPNWVFALCSAMHQVGREPVLGVFPDGAMAQYLDLLEEEEVGDDGSSLKTAHTAFCEFFRIPNRQLSGWMQGRKFRSPPQPPGCVAEVLGTGKCSTPAKLLGLLETLGLSIKVPAGAAPHTSKAKASAGRRWAASSSKADGTVGDSLLRLHYTSAFLQVRASLLERLRPAQMLRSVHLSGGDNSDEYGDFGVLNTEELQSAAHSLVLRLLTRSVAPILCVYGSTTGEISESNTSPSGAECRPPVFIGPYANVPLIEKRLREAALAEEAPITLCGWSKASPHFAFRRASGEEFSYPSGDVRNFTVGKIASTRSSTDAWSCGVHGKTKCIDHVMLAVASRLSERFRAFGELLERKSSRIPGSQNEEDDRACDGGDAPRTQDRPPAPGLTVHERQLRMAALCHLLHTKDDDPSTVQVLGRSSEGKGVRLSLSALDRLLSENL